VVEDYGIPAPYNFSGKIAKITVELKDMKVADKAAADSAHVEAALRAYPKTPACFKAM
jgi:hypothetical protein